MISAQMHPAAPLANAFYGVLIQRGASNNWIGVNPVFGSETSDQRNVISGNTSVGVYIARAGSSGNTVAGNDIGTNSAGSQALPNAVGVELTSGAAANLIGSNGDGVSDGA